MTVLASTNYPLWLQGQGYQNPMFAAGNRSSRHGSVSYKPSVIESPRADEWELPASSVMVEEELAEGCFGLVHKGIVKGPLPHSRTMKNSICETVAIKFLKRKNLELKGTNNLLLQSRNLCLQMIATCVYSDLATIKL